MLKFVKLFKREIIMLKSLTKYAAWLAVAASLTLISYWYLQHKKQFPSTEDAYVQANTIQVAAQVSGLVKRINTEDHQHVQKPQVLVEIDRTPFALAYEQAQAEQQNIQEQLQAALSNIGAAKALVAQRQTELAQTKKQLERTTTLVRKNIRPEADLDEAQTQFKRAEAGLHVATSKLEEAKQMAGQFDQDNAKLRIAKARVAKAKWTLDNTKIVAPTDGITSNFNVRAGDTLAAGRPLFTIVEDDSFWISANFKETDLQRMQIGQPVKIQLDMYPKQVFHGEISSISSRSGSSMALLPAENASGNWVKVTQRFPVHIKVTDMNAKYPFRVGASAKVTIDTTKQHV